MMNSELHVALDTPGSDRGFPAGRRRRGGRWRRPASEARAAHRHDAGRGRARGWERALGWDDVSPTLLRRLRIDVAEVRWFSTYRVHHRVAPQFRRGRAFLLGDAAHVHSPVGGQGMNTGLGDAVNLAWKLAAVLDGRAA